MRLLNVILTALVAAIVLMAGLVVAALVALAGAVFVGLKRFRRPAVHAAPTQARRNVDRPTDVIEITATEVTADRVAGPAQT